MSGKQISTTFITLLLANFILIGLTDKGYSNAVPASFGSCCIDQSDGECFTCDFFGCAYSKSFCEGELGGNFGLGAGGVCVNEGEGPRCGDGDTEEPGCCVIEQGNCEDEIIRGNCFDDEGEGAEFWVFNEACSNVPECRIVQRPIPTLSEWGLIAMAGVLGIVGFMAIRRRKATA